MLLKTSCKIAGNVSWLGVRNGLERTEFRFCQYFKVHTMLRVSLKPFLSQTAVRRRLYFLHNFKLLNFSQ